MHELVKRSHLGVKTDLGLHLSQDLLCDHGQGAYSLWVIVPHLKNGKNNNICFLWWLWELNIYRALITVPGTLENTGYFVKVEWKFNSRMWFMEEKSHLHIRSFPFLRFFCSPYSGGTIGTSPISHRNKLRLGKLKQPAWVQNSDWNPHLQVPFPGHPSHLHVGSEEREGGLSGYGRE